MQCFFCKIVPAGIKTATDEKKELKMQCFFVHHTKGTPHSPSLNSSRHLLLFAEYPGIYKGFPERIV
jgi:hypothetical protein